ncbi:two-component system response regulator BtsR [Rhizobiales bacterium RZME27]|uniref:Two-component system response regulator BtsR n=1 Tax=Endobacterium cereale TaxID=2663029 RepID=A0A6A8AIP9_9HYPH|nr:two-component system response regulator BtsR [Endobacterium cereale]MEB2844259.1 two-component system response regulator BtsR [Endobacterium cereale]MQY48671.1 two-component system response regulator BtsR [Endobacterium cereale]
MKVLIVDDEALARDELKSVLADQADIEIVGECANAIEGIAAINRLSPTVMFLDIQMPQVSGLEMVGMIDPEKMPQIVFLTAYEEYAVRAFEENAFDYLLKPIQEERLQKTLDRLRKAKAVHQDRLLEIVPPLRHIPCTGLNRIRLMKIEDVEAIFSRPGGIYVIGNDGAEHFTELTLRTLEERTRLIRCHRQYMINPEHIQDIALAENGAANILTIGGRSIPVSRRFLGPLKEQLGIL